MSTSRKNAKFIILQLFKKQVIIIFKFKCNVTSKDKELNLKKIFY